MDREQDILFGTQASASDIEEIKREFHPLNTVNVNILFPVGAILPMSGNLAPDGFLPCDGRVVDIEDYPNLANYYEQAQGSKNFYGGDGETTFAVPDLRGEFLRGTGTNSHSNQGNGASVGVHQDGTGIANVQVNTTSNDLVIPMHTDSNLDMTNFDAMDNTANKAFILHGSGSTPSWVQGQSQYPKVRPTNTSVLYCVKY